MYRQLRTRIALGSLLFLAACGDFIFGAAKVSYLCEHEAGPKIYRTVQGVEGYFEEGPSPGPPFPVDWPDSHKKKYAESIAKSLRNDGYLWEEGERCVYLPTERCRYFRSTLTKDGVNITWAEIPRPTRYVVVREGKSVFPYITENHRVVKDINTGEVLARYVSFGHRGGWLFHDYEGYRHGCGPRHSEVKKMVIDVLQPIGARNG